MRSVARFLERQALRLEVRWSQWSLDTMLSAGFDPTSDPALALRAAELRSMRHRRRLAAAVERLAHDSDREQRGGISAAVPIVREQVKNARESLLALADTLRSADHVRPRGVAMVERLLSDGGSVIYTDSARGAVELQVQAALRFLVDEREAAREPVAPLSRESGERAPKPPRGARPQRRPRDDPA